LFSLIRYNLKGAGLVAVVYTDTSFGADGIVAKQEINTIRDLKGKTIGVTMNSTQEYILGVALERNGLSLSDVTLVDMPGEETAGEFNQGKIDAIVTWEPFVTEAIDKGKGRRLFDTSEMPGICPIVFTFSKKFIAERPQDAQAFVNVWHKTTQFMKENPKEAFQIIADIYKKPRAEVAGLAQIDKILDLQDNLSAFSFSTGFESLHGAAYRINDFMLKKGITDKQLDSLEFLDDQFIRALKRESR
jgi:NitT/TauT family transport system substrate-binding protein